jgi:hypothetical protein
LNVLENHAQTPLLKDVRSPSHIFLKTSQNKINTTTTATATAKHSEDERLTQPFFFSLSSLKTKY